MDQTLCRSGRSHFFCYDKSRNGKIFPFATNLWKCVLRTDQSISYKSIKQFDWICRIQIAKKINIFSHLDISTFVIIEEMASGLTYDGAPVYLAASSKRNLRFVIHHVPLSPRAGWSLDSHFALTNYFTRLQLSRTWCSARYIALLE